ncbi:unnamed protein product [Eruca vesicaria subsp. sativa]|uniref:Uncharacterized protein n=1 Tax=Eruca vesicaria subsp. sativa TaxID=29727 RepID=A0ABC8IXQ9_ERUVS|nr:unnamed protein product [Eruca vesicaria subsp. sativa]
MNRNKRKVQEQPHVEQDIAFSTKPSPARPVSAKKPVAARANNREDEDKLVKLLPQSTIIIKSL